jgi:hypothetical protein
VANKRKLHHWLVVIKHVRTWQLILLLILLTGLSAYLLRQNNLGMVERRNLVKQADESSGDVVPALSDLQHYVSTHMNTGLGEGIFLEHTYQRAYDQVVQQAAGSITANNQAYKDVEAGCRQQYIKVGSFSTYLKCIENGLKSLTPGKDPLASVKAPPQELFKYNFVSPAWSLDWAGLAALATLLVAVLVILRIAGYITLQLLLKMRSHN